MKSELYKEIQLPSNTPDETVELIETILMERAKEEPSKD